MFIEEHDTGGGSGKFRMLHTMLRVNDLDKSMNPSDLTFADPATTCPGAPDSSVKAVLGEVSLSPTIWRSNEDGTIKNVECEGWIRYAGDRVNGEVLTNETSQ